MGPMKKTEKTSNNKSNAKSNVAKNQQIAKINHKKADKGSKVPSTKSAKAQNSKKESDLDDTLLDIDVAETEVIPDLEEFDEKENAKDDTSDDEMVVETNSEITLAQDQEEEIYLTDAEGRRLCRIRDCDQAAIVETYCRFHYLQNWKRIQVRRKILADGKLDFYVDELTSRYPDKFLEMIRKDLKTEKDFIAAIAELEIDESNLDNDNEDESQEFIDEVRGVTETSISDDDDY
jgi:hypothetical protein